MATRETAIQFNLLGTFEVLIDGLAVRFGGPKQRALLAYLSLHADESVDIPTLIHAVWGDDPHDGAIRSLRTYLSNLRRIVEPDAEIVAERGTYTLSLRSAETDVRRFRQTVDVAINNADAEQRGRRLRVALDLWRGPFLLDIDRDWVQEEAAIIGWERQRAVAAWAKEMIAAGEAQAVIPTIEYEVTQVPFDERMTGLLMQALYGTGRHSEALAVYRRLRNGLASSLGLEPGPEVRRLEQQILLHDARLNGYSPRTTLPRPLGDLVGRDNDVIDIVTQLENARLLTLTGPGGVGKSRLAIEAARSATENADRPVYHVDFSAVFDDSMVDAILASSAGVQPQRDVGPLVSLIEYLGSTDVLLIVDNCEHLAPTIAHSVVAILQNCSGVTVMATSRSPLGIEGEVERRTDALALPKSTNISLSSVEQAPAAVLLACRAPRDFTVTATNFETVEELCRLLDGLPLAIELAASRLGSMTPTEIVAALDSTDPISRGARSNDPRHGTLAAIFNWSYDLMSPAERGLLNRLGVMSGHFLLQDVVAVCMTPKDTPEAVRECLSALVGMSLVSADTSGLRTRYRLLKTIRRFSLDRLGEDVAEFRQRHARYYCGLAEFHAARLLTRDEADAFGELEAAHENIRLAIGWAMDVDDVEVGSRIVASMPDWGYFHSHYELSRWAEWAWHRSSPTNAHWRAVCGAAARGAWLAGRFADAVRFGAAAPSTGSVIARSGYPEDAVADVALYCGDPVAALRHYSDLAIDSARSDDLERGAWANCFVAIISAVLGLPDEAAAAARTTFNEARRLDNPSALAFSLYASALAAKHRLPADAIAMFEEAVLTAESVGNSWISGISRMELAAARAQHDEMHTGLTDFASVIDHWHRTGSDTQLRLTWRYLVPALIDVGLLDDATILTGALLASEHAVLTHPNQHVLGALDESLGHARYAHLTMRGSMMRVPDLVALSLDAVARAISDDDET